jgi:hypothetical protein
MNVNQRGSAETLERCLIDTVERHAKPPWRRFPILAESRYLAGRPAKRLRNRIGLRRA